MSFDESFEDEVKVTIIATGFEEQDKSPIIKKPGVNIWGNPIDRKPQRDEIRKQSDNYITRSLKNTEDIVDPVEKSNVPVEDDDTPAFVRRNMNQNNNNQ
jgi:cell division GTPase FtsZ